MKTAEEWALEMHSIGCVLPYPYGGYASLSCHIKQIQLDAMKEGMRRAAKIAKDESDKVSHEDPFAHQAILTAAEQLTEKDL